MRDDLGWYSPSGTCLNTGTTGALSLKKWRRCPVPMASLAAHPWIAEVLQAYRLQSRLGLAPVVRSAALDAAMLIVDEEVGALRAVERAREGD